VVEHVRHPALPVPVADWLTTTAPTQAEVDALRGGALMDIAHVALQRLREEVYGARPIGTRQHPGRHHTAQRGAVRRAASIVGDVARNGLVGERIEFAADAGRRVDLHKPGLAVVQPVMESLEPAGPSPALGALYATFERLLFVSGRYDESVSAAKRGAEVAAAVGDERLAGHQGTRKFDASLRP